MLEPVFRTHEVGAIYGIAVHSAVGHVSASADSFMRWNMTVADLPESDIRTALRAVAVGAAENVHGASLLLAGGSLSLVQHALRAILETTATAAVLGRSAVAAAEFNIQATALSSLRRWQLLADLDHDSEAGDDSIAQIARDALARTDPGLLRYHTDRWWAAEPWFDWCQRKGGDWCRTHGVRPPKKPRAPSLRELRLMAGLADGEHAQQYEEYSSWVHQDPDRLVNRSHARISHPVAIVRDACAVVSRAATLMRTLNTGVLPRLKQGSPAELTLVELELQVAGALAAVDDVFARDCIPAVRQMLERESNEAT